MNARVCTVAIGKWYPRGAARMINAFHQFNPDLKVMANINVLPPGAPPGMVDDRYDYTGYCAKPFALAAAMFDGADIGLLLDASVYPIRSIEPLLKHIEENGYYMAPAGFSIGQWASDEALEYFGVDREDAFGMADCASGIVGLNFRTGEGKELLRQWCVAAPAFPGYHSNSKAGSKEFSYRNEGFLSDDPRVLGHRHDQTALSIICHQMGMTHWTPWPKFVAYQYKLGNAVPPETCLLIAGMQ